MAIGCGAKFAKIILGAFNIIFILTGCCLIAAGIALIVDHNIINIIGNISTIISSNDASLFRDAAILLIAMGAFILVVSALGFFSAICESYPGLAVYITLLVVIFCGEIAGGVIAMVYKTKIETKIEGYLDSFILNAGSYYNRTRNANNQTMCSAGNVGVTMDYIQIKFQCCGVTQNDMTYDSLNVTVKQVCPELGLPGKKPLTCYATNIDSGTVLDSYLNTANETAMLPYFNTNMPLIEGCADALSIWIDQYAPALIGIGIGFAVFQLFGIVFAVCLCQNLSDYKDF